MNDPPTSRRWDLGDMAQLLVWLELSTDSRLRAHSLATFPCCPFGPASLSSAPLSRTLSNHWSMNIIRPFRVWQGNRKRRYRDPRTDRSFSIGSELSNSVQRILKRDGEHEATGAELHLDPLVGRRKVVEQLAGFDAKRITQLVECISAYLFRLAGPVKMAYGVP